MVISALVYCRVPRKMKSGEADYMPSRWNSSNSSFERSFLLSLVINSLPYICSTGYGAFSVS
jgi:hypothetical protein